MKYTYKYFLFFFFMLMLPVVVSSQELSVVRFFENQNDLTANTSDIVRDQNGEVCALIKIETTLDGFTFDVGSLGITETKRVGGEIWVFVPADVRRITISHPQLGVIRDYTFDKRLEKGRTYIMKLSAKLGSIIYDSSKKQKMLLQVIPSNASVEINGISVILDKNGMNENDYSIGAYELVVSAPRYHKEKIVVVLDNPNETKWERIELKQAYGWLRINSNNGGKLKIDGVSRSFTSGRDIELDSGHHQIYLEKPHFKPYSCNVEIKDSTLLEISPKFEINARQLEFFVDSNAEIWLDDRMVGSHQWQGLVDYGEHTIECKLAGYKTTTYSLIVDRQTLGPIRLESPEPINGCLKISTAPDGANVFVDDKMVGCTPCTSQLIVGEHRVSIRKSGYNTVEKMVAITENETYSIICKMENIIPIIIETKPKYATLYLDEEQRKERRLSLIAGQHFIKLAAPGYCDFAKKIDVEKPNETFRFNMKRRCYYPGAFYLGVLVSSAFQDFSVGGYIGAYIKNFNFEGHTLYGPINSETIYWNSSDSEIMPLRYTYKPLIVGGKLGYGFVLGNRIRLTPQVGANYIRLSGKRLNCSESGFNPSKCEAISLTSTLKLSVAVASWLEFSLSPEYDYAVYKSNIYDAVFNASPTIKSWSDGVRVNFGFGLFF